MSNIWEFLLQTAEVTMAAVILLMLKLLFQDKLSPKWQYGVWTILAAKLLLPAGIFGKYISLDLAAVIDVCKLHAECRIISQFSDTYMDVRPESGFPYMNVDSQGIAMPQSVTDWLFVIYLAGVILSIVYYLWGYLRLRLILRTGWQASQSLQDKMAQVCVNYALPSCKTIIIDGIDSAFICGFVHPTLVIPAHQEESIDEKILLHELIHKKYFDVWQNGFWCFMRCIHWCNPIMHLIFNRIGNDMESLCDQRVLECIQGEARRDYGRILLDMTNRKYARAMGTTSLSNGGRNIKRRIEALIRFKKYPKGMALVSVCICLLIASPVFGGTAQDLNFEDNTGIISDKEIDLARIRLQGCGTVAGAIDTYIKGLLYDDERYLAAVTATSQQYRTDTIAVSNEIGPIYDEYCVVNLQKQEDDSIICDILLCELESVSADNEEEDDAAEKYRITVLPIRLYPEKHRWIAEQNGSVYQYQTMDYPAYHYQQEIPVLQTYHAENEDGQVTVQEQSLHYIKASEKDGEGSWFYNDNHAISAIPNANANFSRHELHYCVTYTQKAEVDTENIKNIAISTRVLTDDVTEPDWTEDAYTLMQGSGGSSGNDGAAIMMRAVERTWEGDLQLNDGCFWLDEFRVENIISEVEAYAVRVYINKQPRKTIIIERRDTDE